MNDNLPFPNSYEASEMTSETLELAKPAPNPSWKGIGLAGRPAFTTTTTMGTP